MKKILACIVQVVLEYTQHKVEHFDGQTLNLKQQIEANDALGVQVSCIE